MKFIFLTNGRIEEIEERVVLNRFVDCANRTLRLVLLLLLDRLDGDVFAFLPVDFGSLPLKKNYVMYPQLGMGWKRIPCTCGSRDPRS